MYIIVEFEGYLYKKMLKKLNILYESMNVDEKDESFFKSLCEKGYVKNEDYKKDKHYRSIAQNFIDILVHDFDEFELHQLLMIEKRPTKGVLVPASQINSDFNFDIMFIYSNDLIQQGVASFTPDLTRPYISFGMGDPNDKYTRKDYEIEVGLALLMDQDSIQKKLFHEIIHYFDYSRTKDKKAFNKKSILTPPTDIEGVKEYFKDEYEYNAWVQTFLGKLDIQVKKEPNKRMLIGKDFNTFINRLKSFVIKIPDESYSSLNYVLDSKFNKKFHKRLYNYWTGKKKELFR